MSEKSKPPKDLLTQLIAMEEEQAKKGHRRTVDHGGPFSRFVLERAHKAILDPRKMRPQTSSIVNLLPPMAYSQRDVITSLPTKFVHTSINKIKHPVLVVRWTPEGRRVLTGSMSGEFTLWNGMTFNFETIMQAHEQPIRSLRYSHNDEWFLSGDQDGIVKFWQPNFNNVNIVNAHSQCVREIAFSPNDSKFVTASDDATLKIWNFNDSSEESKLAGHGWDVKCCDWHPTLGLIVSGSKDNLIKLWDPRSGGNCLTTLHGFKNTVTKILFQKNGNQRLLASTSRDHTGRIFDLRMMKDLMVLRGHNSDVSALAWHPIHSTLVTTGTHDGVISHFILDTHLPENSTGLEPVLQIPHAHDWPIWSLDYHPAGHILCSGSNDKLTRFWARSRPGDDMTFKDRYYLEELKDQPLNSSVQPAPSLLPSATLAIPGLHIANGEN